MSGKRIAKAVIPAAGYGTRMLPFTKAVPKELVPLVDKPVLQYVVEEAVDSGITDILMIISAGKEAIIQHFNPVPDLEQRLAATGKTAFLAEVRRLNSLARIQYVYQQDLNGLGGAIALAESFAGDDPVAVLLGDTVMQSLEPRPVCRQLIDVYESSGASVVAVTEVPREKISRYGVIGGQLENDGIVRIDTLVEKPAPEAAPSNLAVAARYVFTPAIFRALAETTAEINGEVQITDAMRRLLTAEPLFGCRIAGKRYDLGSKAGFLTANLEFALRRADLRGELFEMMKKQLSSRC